MTRSESAGLADIELKSSCMVVCHTSIETSNPCRVDVPPLHDPPHFRKATGECESDCIQRRPMAQTELMAPMAPRTLEVCSLAGAATVEADAAVLHRQIEEHLGIPAECQVWLNQLGEAQEEKTTCFFFLKKISWVEN